MISAIIPSRHEPYLNRTINDLRGEVDEIIVVLDGYWVKEPVEGVIYIHFGKPRGMRSCINAGVKIAKGDYILKCDAHCKFPKGFTQELLKAHINNWIQVPTRKRLDPVKWEVINDNRPDINYMTLDKEYRGRLNDKMNRDPDLAQKKLDEIEAFQGSCWFMRKYWFRKLRLLDVKRFGEMGHESQEIYFKCKAKGGKVMRNKNTWYAHWHKIGGKGYDRSKSRKYIKEFVKSYEL